jgi:hypothetical protein
MSMGVQAVRGKKCRGIDETAVHLHPQIMVVCCCVKAEPQVEVRDEKSKESL